MNEKDQIRNIKNGCQYSLKQLFEQYQEYVYNICCRMSGNREEAEDATQDVFIKIFHNIEKFRGDAKLSSWIYRVAVNTCLKRERRKKLNKLISLDFLFQDKEIYQPISPDEAPDRQLEISETESLVQQAIRQLPSRQKTALILYRYENLSYTEIASVMEISLPAVESLLFRAKENLTKKLLPLKKHVR